MKIIEPSFEILKKESHDKMIELAGRTCYKSEDKITDSSSEKFVKMLIDRKHFAMIEHATETLRVTEEIYNEVKSKNPKYLNLSNYNNIYIISGNLRAFREFYFETNACPEIIRLFQHNSSVFKDIFMMTPLSIEDIAIISHNKITHIPEEYILKHTYLTVKFISNRGFTHELVRHRSPSFAQESTRYCNYSKNKFGNQLTAIKPYWWDSGPFVSKVLWKANMKFSEILYRLMTKKLPAQAVRGILPIDIKTEIIITANLEEWNHIFSLRCAKEAHPDMQRLMISLREEVRKMYPGLL